MSAEEPREPAPADPPLTAVGDRVEVRPPRESDTAAYAEAVTRSMRRLSDFAMPDPTNFPIVLHNQSHTYRTFLVLARDPEGDHGLVGRVNVANVVGGAFRSATVGYDAYDPYVGRGLFSEGLELAVDLAFADEPHGMGLHRLEANIQPANTRSAGLVRSLGFVHEGFSRDFLHLPGIDGRRAWRDHDRYTVLSSDWPAVPYRVHGLRRLACVVLGGGGYAGPAGPGLAPALAAELGVPLLSASALVEPGSPGAQDSHATAVLFELLRTSPVGGVVECRASAPEVRMGLARSGFDPSAVPILDAAVDVSRREVVRHALAVRAAFA
ncbi:GNAT family protein [Intrasporangium sp. YIM S08009]|uniref:GNAT family N-acetyltransferase n=1 Tax=Intrasporangium zincisolvens TaxID=3080018 RepID=UPI002B0533D3|nr:GNAT family protein [Intrasporangium sp. YIM S08009]